MKRYIFGLALICLIPCISGLMCYWCSGVGNDRDCERKPLGIKSGPSNVNCSSKFCTTAKVMDLENGDVKSFARFCDNVYRGNRCVKDTKLMTCYQACVYDHCNNGNPSPKYLRVENLLQPDPDSKKKLSAEISTDSQFHFFTAPSAADNNPPNPFKEQSIFKAFTTHQPTTTPPPLATEPPSSSTERVSTTTMAATTTTEQVRNDSDQPSSTVADDLQSSDSIPSVSSLIVDNNNTTDTMGDKTDTDVPSQASPEPSTDIVSPPVTQKTDGEPDPENSVDDLGSEAPVDYPELPQQDSPPATLSPEPVKEHHRTAGPEPDPKIQTKKDVIYTTPKPTPSTEAQLDDYQNGVEKNITQPEELNLAATQNATDTSGAISSFQRLCVSVTLLSILTHVL